MTWAIQTREAPRPAMGIDAAPSTNWQGFSAATKLTFQNTYGTVERQAKIVGEQDTMAAEAVKRLGPDGMKPIIDDFNSRATSMGLTERIIPEGATTDEILGRLGSNGSKAILDAARLAAETNPSAWADLDLSQDGIDAKVTERMAAERRVNEELLALSPNPVWNNLIGGIAGTVLDPINIAAAIATGGGGSLWRVMMREAIAGAGVEAAEQPLRVKTAEELSLPAPNLLENMALGAAGGAIFGGILEGVPRAIRAVAYARRLRDTTTLPGIDPVASESAVRAAETAIDRDMNPLDAVAEVLRDSPVPMRRDPLILGPEMRRDPLMLTPDMSVTASTPEPTALAPDPITTSELPDGRGPVYGDDARNDIGLTLREIFDDAFAKGAEGNIGGVSVHSGDFENLKAGADAFLDGLPSAPKMLGRSAQILADIGYNKAKQQVEMLGYQPVATPKPDPITTESLAPLPGDAPTTPGETAAMAERALSKAVKRGPKPEKQIDLSTFVVRAGGIWKGDDTGEIAALQYKRPGFTKRNLFARTTAGDNGGGLKLDMMRERATEAGYLPQGSTVADFLNALRDDVTGTAKRYPNGDAPQKRSNFSPDYTPDYSPQDAYLAQDKSIDGFWVDPNLVGLMTPEQAGKEVAAQLDEYLARKGITLTPRERFDISNELETRGGDGAYLVERAMERWTDEHEALLLDRQRRNPNVRDEWIPFGDEGDVAGPADQAGRPGDGKQPPDASGASGRGADAPELPAYEATPIGDQAVIPGTRNGDVGKQAALRAKAEAELKALQSKQSRLNQVRVEDEVDGLFARKTLDIFDDITSPEAQKAMDVEMRDIRQMAEEGGIESLQDIVDEIDDMDTLAREFDLCRRGGTEE
jgi:hypothetical protein